MAEFDDPNALVAAARSARTRGLSPHGRVLAVSDRGAARGARARTHTRLPLIVLIGGIVGCLGGYVLQYWVVGDRVSAERRRQAAAQLAGVHPGHVRVHDSRRGAVGGARHAGAERAAACRITRCSTCRGSRWPAATGSSCASRRAIRSSISRARARFSKRSSPREVTDSCGLSTRRTRDAEIADTSARGSACSAFCRVVLVLTGVGLPPGHARPAEVHRRCAQSTFFADGRSARPLVAGTVARGQLHEDALLYTGKSDGADADGVSVPGRRAGDGARPGALQHLLLAVPRPHRARRRHGRARGYRRPPSYHNDRLRNAPVGHFFDVITNGFGAMPDYAAQIKARRSLGDRRLHPRAAAERARDARRRAAPTRAELDRSDDVSTQTADDADSGAGRRFSAAADRRRRRRGACRSSACSSTRRSSSSRT